MSYTYIVVIPPKVILNSDKLSWYNAQGQNSLRIRCTPQDCVATLARLFDIPNKLTHLELSLGDSENVADLGKVFSAPRFRITTVTFCNYNSVDAENALMNALKSPGCTISIIKLHNRTGEANHAFACMLRFAAFLSKETHNVRRLYLNDCYDVEGFHELLYALVHNYKNQLRFLGLTFPHTTRLRECYEILTDCLKSTHLYEIRTYGPMFHPADYVVEFEQTMDARVNARKSNLFKCLEGPFAFPMSPGSQALLCALLLERQQY